IAKNLDEARIAQIADIAGLSAGDAIFFVAGKADDAAKFAGAARTKIGEELGLIDANRFEFCW
ncbi:MAG TPA: aspartate--tRNA ligase, partial [Rhodospirillaceae bacterium]|nr:aspartate--tRNA ligase [Rhodospirillaceae bacterium]